MTEAINENGVVDPQNPPETEPTDPPVDPPDTPPADPQNPPQDPPPPEDPDERVLQKIRSWQGRRDAELLQKIDQRLSSLQQSTSTPTQPHVPEQPTADFYQEPATWFKQMREIEDREKAQKTQAYNTTLVNSIQATLAQDTNLNDPANESLKNEIWEEIRKSQVDANMDPRFAGPLVVNAARAAVYARRLSQPKNPLQGNQRLNVPVGGTTPSASVPPKSAPKVKLDEHAARLAQKFGMSDEDVAKVLG